MTEAVLSSRGGGHGSWPWSRKLLAAADAQFGGAWREGVIDGAAALDVRLPPHAGEPCKGDLLTLVGGTGASVGEAVETFTKVADAYGRHNATCMSRIQFAADAPFSRLVLCPSPLDADDYRDVTPADGAWYCVDGFHRLIGWAWRGRLAAGVAIPVWLAGSSSN